MSCRVLLIGIDDGMRELLADFLTQEGFRVVEAWNRSVALAKLWEGPYQAIVLDKSRAGLEDLGILTSIAERAPGVPVIILGAYGEEPETQERLRQSGFAYLEKPVTLDALGTAVRAAVDRAGAVR